MSSSTMLCSQHTSHCQTCKRLQPFVTVSGGFEDRRLSQKKVAPTWRRAQQSMKPDGTAGSGWSGRHDSRSIFLHRSRNAECVKTRVWPFDQAWDVDSQSVASNLFASSIIPYAGFLYHLQRSKKAPKLMLFGFYFLLVFVVATIIAGVYAKLHYNSILANVDWLHGSAESFLTITNLFIVLGLRQGIVEAEAQKQLAEREISPEEEKAKSR